MAELLSVTSMRRKIVEHHYTHSVPSGKSLYFQYGEAIIVFSIPANRNISQWLVGRENAVWELSRLWAPDGHEANLLTKAISAGAAEIKKRVHSIEALISYADPNVGHEGGVYRAASWQFLGQCEEARSYRGPNGEIVSRRAFHSGKHGMTKREIERLGYVELRLPGKLRFARGLTARGRSKIRAIANVEKGLI
jgi:hypothetical protein